MNWSPRTKILALLGMMLSNLLVLIGGWLSAENGGINAGPAWWGAGGVLFYNVVFFWFVLIFPAIQNQHNKS